MQRLRGYEIVLGFMLALACVVFILALSTSTTSIIEVCEKLTHPDQKNCTAYGVFGFTGWLLQTYNGAIQAIAAACVAAFTYTLMKLARDQSDITRALQRAFVTLDGWRFLSHASPEGNVWWSFHFNWKNSGVSPAVHARVSTGMYLGETEIPETFKFDFGHSNEIFIGPQAIVGTGNIGVKAEDLVAVREKRKFLYFWGRVDYRDIFEATPDHVTKFAFQVLDFRGDVTNVWHAEKNFVELITQTLGRYNCADESCPPD